MKERNSPKIIELNRPINATKRYKNKMKDLLSITLQFLLNMISTKYNKKAITMSLVIVIFVVAINTVSIAGINISIESKEFLSIKNINMKIIKENNALLNNKEEIIAKVNKMIVNNDIS